MGEVGESLGVSEPKGIIAVTYPPIIALFAENPFTLFSQHPGVARRQNTVQRGLRTRCELQRTRGPQRPESWPPQRDCSERIRPV
jgi:hypothetical protein